MLGLPNEVVVFMCTQLGMPRAQYCVRLIIKVEEVEDVQMWHKSNTCNGHKFLNANENELELTKADM